MICTEFCVCVLLCSCVTMHKHGWSVRVLSCLDQLTWSLVKPRQWEKTEDRRQKDRSRPECYTPKKQQQQQQHSTNNPTWAENVRQHSRQLSIQCLYPWCQTYGLWVLQRVQLSPPGMNLQRVEVTRKTPTAISQSNCCSCSTRSQTLKKQRWMISLPSLYFTFCGESVPVWISTRVWTWMKTWNMKTILVFFFPRKWSLQVYFI